jgi:hypothetical protein
MHGPTCIFWANTCITPCSLTLVTQVPRSADGEVVQAAELYDLRSDLGLRLPPGADLSHAPRVEESADATAVRARRWWSSAVSVLLCKSVFCGDFAWARRALNRKKRRFPARAVAPLGPAQQVGYRCAGGRRHPSRATHLNRQQRPGEKDTKLARKLGQHQPFSAVLPQTGMHGPTWTDWANLRVLIPFSLQTAGVLAGLLAGGPGSADQLDLAGTRRGSAGRGVIGGFAPLDP